MGTTISFFTFRGNNIGLGRRVRQRQGLHGGFGHEQVGGHLAADRRDQEVLAQLEDGVLGPAFGLRKSPGRSTRSCAWWEAAAPAG